MVNEYRRPPQFEQPPQKVERFSVDWFRLAFADIKDNIPFATPAPEARKEGEPNPMLQEKLLTKSEQRMLREAVRLLPEGVEHEVTLNVGTKERGTSHPHRFVVKNTGTTAEIFFIDPEDHVGIAPAQAKPRVSLAYVQDVLRPRIVNLVAAHLPFDEGATPTMMFLRYQSERVQERLKAADPNADIDRLDFQLAIAKDALAHQGMPEILREVPQEIVTRIFIEPERAVVQDRHSQQREVQKFVETGSGSPILEAKLVASRQVLRRLTQVMQQKTPKPLR